MKVRCVFCCALLLLAALCACSSAAVFPTGGSTPPETPPSQGPAEPEPVLTLEEVLVSYSARAEEPLAVELASQLQLKRVDSASAAHHEQLQAAVDAAAKRYGAIGVQVAVVEDGVVTDSFAYGWATKTPTP